MKKHKVPQISEKGVSCDYINEFGALYSIVKSIDSLGEKNFREKQGFLEEDYILKEATIPRQYEERFNPEIYENVVNGANVRRIRRINTLAMEIKLGLENKSTDFSKFKKNIRGIVFFIRGDKLKLSS